MHAMHSSPQKQLTVPSLPVRLLATGGVRCGCVYVREFALWISLTSLGSNQTLRLPHLSTEAARRFCNLRDTMTNATTCTHETSKGTQRRKGSVSKPAAAGVGWRAERQATHGAAREQLHTLEPQPLHAHARVESLAAPRQQAEQAGRADEPSGSSGSSGSWWQ
jgi:hypothetical protein